MLSSNSRKHNQSGFCWSLLFVVCLSEVKAFHNLPIVDSDIVSLFGSDPCIPGTLMVEPISVPVAVGVSQPQVQEHHITSTEHTKGGSNTEEMTTVDHSMTKEKTPMCLVNELARHNKIEHQYRLTDEKGPAHKKRFTVTLRLGTEEYTDVGPSIKKAQHSAASVALQRTSYRHPPPKNLKQQNRPGKGNITPTVELNALAMKRGEPTDYTFVEIPPAPPHNNYNYYHRGMYTQSYNEPYGNYNYNSNNRGKSSNYRHPNARNQRNAGPPQTPVANTKGFKVKVKVGDKEFIGEGGTAQAAKHDAASKALTTIKELPINPVANIVRHQADNGVEPDSSSELKSPISLVHEIALKRNMTVSFDVVSEKGPPHMRIFVTKCSVGDQFEATAEGNGKKISKKRAAEKMLELLRKLPPVTSATVNTNPSRMKRKGSQNKKKPRNLIKETKPVVETSQPKEEKQEDLGSDEMNPISRLIQIQQAKKEKEPIYIFKEERGAPRRREFLIQVSVGETSYVGSGPNKKVAKRNAAEGLLQLLGYSSPSVNREGAPISQSQSSAEAQPPATNPGGPKGRQIVPGLLLMNNDKTASAASPHSGASMKATAAVAKEYLNSHAAAAKDSEVPTSRPSVQLDYLAKILNFKVQYTNFRKSSQNEFLSLVSLSTDPPQVCHGSGHSTDLSKDQAALSAMRSLAEMGLDSITSSNKKPQETITTNVTLNATGLNTTAAAHEMYLGMGNSLAKEDGFLNGK